MTGLYHSADATTYTVSVPIAHTSGLAVQPFPSCFTFHTGNPHSPLEVEHVGRIDWNTARPDMTADVWAIRLAGRCFGRADEWCFEPQPSSSERMGSDGGAWLRVFRWTLPEALAAAAAISPRFTSEYATDWEW